MFMKWLEKYTGDKEIDAIFQHLKKIGEDVFNKKCSSIEHFVCKDIPQGMDEDAYILVFRKTQQIIRYEIYHIMNKHGGNSASQEMKEVMLKEID